MLGPISASAWLRPELQRGLRSADEPRPGGVSVLEEDRDKGQIIISSSSELRALLFPRVNS